MDELIKEFLVESYENLDRLDEEFVALEKDPTATDKLAGIFRAIHTIKGTCGFLGFTKLESVTHVGENLLSKLRDGVQVLDAERTTSLLTMVDAVREILGHIENSGGEGDGDYTALVNQLSKLNESSNSENSESLKKEPLPSPELPQTEEIETKPMGELLVEKGHTSPSAVSEAIQEQAGGDPRHVGEILVEKGNVKPEAVKEVLKEQAESSTKNSSLADNSIRVDVGLLGNLMDLVGELVLARNQILQHTSTYADSLLNATTQRLNIITTELQEGIMKTRMQPIGNIWGKFPRVVRDLSAGCGKKIRLEMEGKETELDRSLIEAIKDPLTHIVRNSVDHGIESPEKRKETGKDEEGQLKLHAYHEGGQVNIVITDDGGGINVGRVKEKAIEKGLITEERASRMGDREAVNLIFSPGFSTAETVTNVSGRGVGMDVVKTNIEKIGGSLDVQSRLGEGTTLKVKIPLTLAIVPALLITSGRNRFAIPQVSLQELVRLEGEEAKTGIEEIYGTPVYRLRGNLLPLVYLNQELNLSNAEESDAANIVVLQADDRTFGLVVDEINDTEEIVVKPLGKQLKGLNVYAGTTIMGDGKVALILDVLGLAQRSRGVSELQERSIAEANESKTAFLSEKISLLLFRSPDDGRMAIPLSKVARLEEFDSSMVERTGNGRVVQYRDQIMLLMKIGELLPERRKTKRRNSADTESGLIQVVVYTHAERSIGIEVEEILDVVEESIAVQQPGSREGIAGCIVIRDRVTELLDVELVLQKALPEFFVEVAA